MLTIKHHLNNDPTKALLWIELFPAIDDADQIMPDTMRYVVAYYDKDSDGEWYRLHTPEVYMPAVPSIIMLDCLTGFICELIDVEECASGTAAVQAEQEGDDDL